VGSAAASTELDGDFATEKALAIADDRGYLELARPRQSSDVLRRAASAGFLFSDAREFRAGDE
jgi:hypothetical protein